MNALWNEYFLRKIQHICDHIMIIIYGIVAGLTALKVMKILLKLKNPIFRKHFWNLNIAIRSQNKVFFSV